MGCVSAAGRFSHPLLAGQLSNAYQAADKDASSFSGKANIALDSDHIGMNKFRSETEHNYLLVLTEIKRMVEKVQQGS